MDNKSLLKTAGVVLLVLMFHQAVTAPMISKFTAKKPATPPPAK